MDNGRLLEAKESKEFLLELIGDEGLEVVRAITGREITDDELAGETGIKLNLVRRILYKLYDYRLASYVRTKDTEIGWYTYTWKLNPSRISDILTERKKHTLNRLMEQLEFETSQVFFSCKKDDSKVPFDIAAEHGFKCPKCDGIMDYVDNKSVVVKLEREINKLKKEISH